MAKAEESGSHHWCQRKRYTSSIDNYRSAPLSSPSYCTPTQKDREKQKQNRTHKVGNKAITLQLSGRNCSFNDKILDDKSDEDSDDGENHQEEESALLVGQASPGPAGLCACPGAQAGCAAACHHIAALLGEGHCGAVGAAQLRSVLALSDGAHAETVVAVELQALYVEGCGRAFVELGTEGRRGGGSV